MTKTDNFDVRNKR